MAGIKHTFTSPASDLGNPNEVGPDEWNADHTITGSITIPKASGTGIMVDTTTPTYAWHDMLGEIRPKATGAGSPTLATFRGGQYQAFSFAASDKCDVEFHIPHDYAPGTDLYVHTHWAHNGTAISGSFVLDYYVSYAKGHGQAIFAAEKQVTDTISTPDIATIPQYSHRINEVQLSTSGGSATLLDTDLLEVDGMILVCLKPSTIPTITGGTARPFVLFLDIHYQSTNVGTKAKAPNFYV